MNINQLGSSSLTALTKNLGTQATKTRSSIPPAAGTAATSNISKPAELLQKLEQLQQDPTQFKQVMSQISDNLLQVADQSGSSNGFAAKLASAFKTAADTGDLSAVQSALTPPPRQSGVSATVSQGAQQHHGHHHGGAMATMLSAALSQVDLALQGTVNAATTDTAAKTAPGESETSGE